METANISEMASKVSSDIFEWFKWKKSEVENINWNCCLHEKHSTQNSTHPSDVVFNYTDPYSGKNIYINVDLKSYAKKTINKNSIQSALESLALATECANISESFKNNYIHKPHNKEVVGLLFIYNHCGEYDKDFYSITSKIPAKKIPINSDNKLFIVCPKTIKELLDITVDIQKLNAQNRLPHYRDYNFYYPDMILSKNLVNSNEAASLEMLTSNQIIIQHDEIETDNGDMIKKGFLIYYKKTEPSTDDFIYLIDTLSHYQMLDKKNFIRIRFIHKNNNAKTVFIKAIDMYIDLWGCDDIKSHLLKNIEFESINTFSTYFSEVEIGMEKR